MLKEFFRAVTGAGIADIEEVESLMNDFEIDPEEFFFEFSDNDIEVLLNLNSIIEQIYIKALEDAGVNYSEYEYYNISIYPNALDSHLYIDGEEMHSKDEIINKLGVL